MSPKRTKNIGEVSLEKDRVISVTKASAHLAEIMRKSGEAPTVVTQNGSPIGVVLGLELFIEMRELARHQLESLEEEGGGQDDQQAESS